MSTAFGCVLFPFPPVFPITFITAPPKPSVQSQFILDVMDAFSQREDDHWSRITKSIDLLFSRVADIDRTQQHMASQLDLSTKVMDQVLQDQQTLAKQMEVTSTMVARLAEHHHHVFCSVSI